MERYFIWEFPDEVRFFMKWKNETIKQLVNEQFMSLVDLVRSFTVRMTHNGTDKLIK